MASITLSKPEFFRNGVGGVSSVVGVESTYNRVARYAFVTPDTGASSLSVAFSGMWFGSGTQPTAFRFYIGTDPDSHINAGADTACTGILQAQSATAFSGSAEVLLLPNTAYYLFVFPNASTFGWYNWEGSAAMTLSGGSYSVPTLSAGAAPMGSALTIYTNRRSDSFTHTLSFKFGDVTQTVATDVGASYSWTPSMELARQIPNAASGVCTVYCATYNGAVQVGTTQQVTLTLTVPDAVVPTVTATWSDSSSAYDRMGTLVKLVSALSVDVAGVGAYGSTVTAASMTLNGKTYAGGIILEAGELPLVVTVRDSRGRAGSAEYTLSVADYAAPALTLTASRCTADGTADDTGEYAKITLFGSTVQVNSQNTATVEWKHGSNTETVDVEVGAFSYEQLVPAPSTDTLTLSATLSDKLLSTTRSMTLSVGYATMDFLRGGRGIALGTTATKEGLTCAMDVEFLGNVGGVIADFVVEQGTEGVWTYRKWNSGVAECWGTYAPGAISCESYTWGGAYFKNIPAATFPTGLFAAAPVLQYSGRAGNFNGAFYKDAGISAASTGSFGMFRTGEFSDITAYIDLYARGTWK